MRSGGNCEHIEYRYLFPSRGERKAGPRLPRACQTHVDLLNLETGQTFLDVQIQAGQCEEDLNWLGPFTRVLGGVCVYSVLVNEGRVPARERII